MRVMMQAEHGHSSETYDFTEVFVVVDASKRIVRRVRLGKLWSMFGWIEGVAYYGHSYEAQRHLHDDLRSGRISIEIHNR